MDGFGQSARKYLGRRPGVSIRTAAALTLGGRSFRIQAGRERVTRQAGVSTAAVSVLASLSSAAS